MKNLLTAFLCLVGVLLAPVKTEAKDFFSSITGNTIGSDQTICFNTTPAGLTGSVPGGGTGVYTYQWQVSSISAITGFTNAVTTQNYAPGALTANRWYRRIVISGIEKDTTTAVAITVTPIITAASNVITGTQTICYNNVPAALNGPTATGGNGTYTYQWQSSPDNITYTNISGASGTGYAPSASTATTWYKRVVSSGGCTSTSAAVQVTVTPVITIGTNTITADQSMCSGQTPLQLVGSTPAGGTGAFTYLWESSTTSASAGFGTAVGTSNGKNYQPPALSQTTWFHRIVRSGGCADTSAAVTETVIFIAPGNPAVYGNGVWNVYGYSDNAFGTYAGFYTEPLLSFNTVTRYPNTQSPSSASGYQGCQIPASNFSASMKQTNFTPGNYQLNLNSLDDNLNIFLNGTQIYAHTCCVAAPINNIWTGFLGSSDQMDLRWVNFGSPGYLSLQFLPVTPAPLVPGVIAQNMQVCYGEAPPSAFANTTSPTSGCSNITMQWQKSIDSVTWVPIPGATALTYTETAALTQTTWYRRSASDACGNSGATSPVKITVNVIAPGDPTVFGDNTWNVYLFQGTGTPGAYNTAVYKGYYTEPLLSFDSRNRWASTASPSSASGYQGCVMQPSNTWVDYKRTDFTPAIYQIDIPYHDDDAYLFINGVQVFVHNGCCDSHTNVWTGPLGATDQVEFRVAQGGGPSYEILTLTPVTPTALTSGATSPSQTICAGDVPPTPFTQSVAPTGGCTIKNYSWDYSADNGATWTTISGATAISYTPTTSVYLQTLFRRTVYDVCGNSAVSVPDTVYMNNSAPGDPTVFGNNTWNVYCFQDINYSIYAGYYTEPLLTFATTGRYPPTSPPSTASGYQGCQLINTYYSVSMKRTGFTAGTYQIDVTSDDDYNLIYINGQLVSSLTYPTIQNNVWTGNLGPTDQIEVRWRNNAGPGQTGVRFTLVTPAPLTPGSIVAYNPNLCFNDLPIINEVTPASGGCFVNYSWQSSVDGGTTWTTIPGSTGNSYTATVSPTTNIQYQRVATDICGNVAYSPSVTFTQTAGTVGNPAVFGNGVWNVYAYDAPAGNTPFSAAQYLGYYVEPLLSFNSLNRWGTNNAPSDASGYQGCQVDQDNHWVSYRQTNITPGTYQIDVPYHDDDAYLYINGTLVWSQTGCCVASTNVWTGIISATDQIEFRWREYNGGSSGALNFTIVTPSTAIVGGTIAATQLICANAVPAAFTSTTDATSTCTVSYQWQRSPDNSVWTDITGATSNVYTSPAIAAKTYFRRKAYNACGITDYSNTVTVDVYPALLSAGSIATDQTICSGTTPTAFSSTGLPSGGNGVYTYQWQSSLDNIGWSNIAAATATTYAPGVLTVTTYYRRNALTCGSAVGLSTNVVKVTINPLVVITTQPANPSSCANGSTAVSVVATGAGLTYQWQVNTGSGFTNVTNVSPYSGATTPTLTINPVVVGMAGYKYQVIITGTCAPVVTSNAVTLAVSNNASITNQPASKTFCEGSNATFSINASGTGIAYQWQQNISGTWTNLADDAVYSGTLTSTLTIAAITTGMSGNIYRCVLNTTCPGTINSNQATLTVTAQPVNTIAADQTVCTGIVPNQLTGSVVGGYAWQSSTVSSSSGFVTASGTSNGQNYSPAALASTTYYQRIVTSGVCKDTSNVVTVTLNNTPITITTQPVAQPVCAGGNATFTATATGPGTLTYLWYENAIPLADGGIYSGTQTNTLTLTGVTAGMNNYSYTLKVFASGCSASSKNSAAALLTTANGPVITGNQINFTTCQGSSVQLNIAATGVGLTYQWQIFSGGTWNNLSNFGSYSNVNTNSLRINPTTAAMDGAQYRCVVTGTCSPFTATTTTTTMSVTTPVANNSISNSQTLCAGTPAPFNGSTPTGGTGTYTYQWYINTTGTWFAISGATGINYSSGPLTQTSQFYRAVSSGGCGAFNSSAITVTILPPTSTTDPSDKTVCTGTNATFTVTGTGSGLSYQWQANSGSGWNNVINGASYTGVTTATLTVVAPPFTFNGYQYRCIVGGGCAPLSVTSNPATLTVNPVAIITAQPGNVNTCQGSNATYSVTATGLGISYQWMEKVGAGAFANITNGGIYSGATSATLTLTGVTAAMNNNQYVCVITLGTCPINSLIASLTVNNQPSLVITNPATICAPGTINLTAPAVTAGSYLGGGILTYWNDIAFTSPVTNPNAISVSGTYYIRVATSAVCYDIEPVVVAISPTIVNNNISASQAICTGSTPVGLTGSAPVGGTSAYTYQWQQSTDNITYTNISGATNPDYSPGALTTTTWYRRIVNSGTCTGTSSPVQITVVAYPVATINYAGSPYCATGTASVTLTGQTGGTYSAPAAVSINSTTGDINLGVSTPGTYTITYNFSNGTCSGSTTASITIKALPTATISYAGSPYCATGTAVVTQTGQAGGTYSAPAGLSIDATTGAINLATSTLGTYTVTYSFNSGGCSNTTTTSITITALPTASISYSGSPYCALGIANVSQSGQTGGTYTAPAAVVIDASTGAVDLVASTPGTYIVTYNFTGGGCSSSTTASITINALPTATISYSGSPYCTTGTATVTRTGTAGGTYAAPAGVSITAATGAINLATSTPGTYTITYSFTSGGCSNTATSSITINAPPTATISYAGTPFCKSLVGAQAVTQTGSTGGIYSSTAGLTIDATTGAITPSTSTAGTYTVTYTMAAAGGCVAQTATTSVTITALPVATFSYAASPYCKNAANPSPTFSGGGVAGTFSSTAGLVFVSATTGQINLATSTPGTYTVTNTIAAAGGCAVVTATSSVTITALPVATFSYTGTPYCNNAANPSPTFSGGGVAGTFSSTAGLVFVSTATGQVDLTASTPGTYTVTNTIVASAGCAVVTATSPITITALPAATISYPGTPFCKSVATAQSVTQTGTTGGTYSSTAGLTINAATGAITPNTSTAGTYTVTYTMAAAGGCAAQTATTSVTITALPVATISYAGTPFCKSVATAQPVTQTGTTGGAYSSTLGLTIDGTTGSITPGTSTPGIYTVTYTIAASGGCAVVTATSSVTITALPVATFSYTGSPYCQNAANPNPTFSGGGVAGTFSSTAGLVFVSATTGQINLAASTPGTYTVTNTIGASGGCAVVTATSTVTITALPVATFSYTGPYCKNAANPSPTFSGGGVAGTFSSTAGLVFVSTTTGQIDLSASTPGTYTVTNTIAGVGGCSVVSATSAVTITALPAATISYAGTPFCKSVATAQSVTQTGTTGGTYSSAAGLTIDATTGAITPSSSSAGTYTVTYTIAAAGGCAVVTATSSVTITALPVATFSYTGTPYCQNASNPSPTFSGGGVAGTFSSTVGLVFVSATTGQIDLSASTPGTYTVTNTIAASGGCAVVTATSSITIKALPVATFSYTGTPYCQNAPNPSPTFSGGGIAGTFSSTVGLVFVSAATGQINLATSAPGTYTVTNTIAASGGCAVVTATTPITIIAQPAATISYAGSPYCATGTATVTQTGTAGGTYTAPAGVSITAATGAIDLATSTPGTYTITYSFTSGGCSNSTTASITINALPTATIAYSGSPYCATGTATVTQTGQAGGTYTAPAGVLITAATGDINLATSTAGTYTITYTFSNGTCSSTATTSITINALPTATISYAGSPYCATGIATVTQTGTAGGTYTAPAGVVINVSTGAIDLASSTPGTFTITYSFSNGTCGNSTSTSIIIKALPTATISYTGSPYCATGTAAVTLTGTTGGTYTAPAGVSITAATGAINLATSTPGTYTVTYSFTSGGCSNTTTASITINALPTATIAYSGSPYCKTGTATVTQTGQAGGTYTAPAAVSINASTGDINLATSTAGTYTITYTFSNGTCSNSTTTSITINALPTATIAYAASPYCATGSASVTQTGVAGGTYTAPAGIVINASTGVIDLATSTTGTYTITYSFSNGTCSNTTTASITINALPTATISYAGSPYCATGTATATQTGQAGGSYTAPAGVSITAATGDINLATSTPGTYTITYSFGNGTCNNTTTTSVTIAALPTASISYAGSPYCATGSATITQTGQTGGTYTAPAGVSITAATGAIDLAASTPGTYTVTYSFSNGTCNNTTTTSITINALPTAAISYAGSPYCATGTATVTQTGQAGGTYTAPAGISITAATGAIDLATSTAGTYTITYSFGNGTCNNTTTTSITIVALPVATISYAGSPYCATGTATVTQTGTAGGSYTAPAGVSIAAATGAIDLATSTPGTYTVTYSFTSGGCSNSTTASVTINPLPTAIISYVASPYCATGTAAVTQTGTTGGTYAAPAGVSISATTGAINLATSTPGTYTITYSFTSGGCSNSTTASITINALPTATVSYAGSPYCATGTATVTQTGQAGGTYTAPAAVVINASTGDINLATSTPGTYTVSYTFTNGTCSNATTTSITINALPTATISYGGSPYCATGTATATQTGTAGGTYTAPAAVSINASTGAIDLVASAPGTYTINYSYSNGTCSNATSTSITINALPTATISYAGSPYCATGTATVTQTGQAGGTYTAPAAVVINAVTGAINLATSTPGTYTVTYSFGNGTCNNTATASITINPLPTAIISYAGSPYCATGTATVTRTGTAGGTYTAPSGVSITAATGDIDLATSTPGTYTITYSFSNGTCNNTTTTSVTINALPTATISYAGSPYCATGTATVSQTGPTGGTYSAPAGVSITAATGAINLATTTPGTYTISYSFTSGGCNNTTTASITINALPTAAITYAASPYCATGTATVTQTGQPGGTYTAPSGVVINASTGDINLATSTPGTYTITYSFTNGTCSNATATSIIINALPAATIAYTGSPYCATGTATVTQTGQVGGTYTAPAGVAINASTGAIDLATSTPGTYTISYNYSNGTCSNATSASITINALPTAAISYAGSPYCATGTATVTQTGTSGGTYSAPAGVVINASTGAINLGTSTAGTYTITYAFSNGTCGNTTTASITISALPVATIIYSGSPYCATGTGTVTQTGPTGGVYSSTPGLNINPSTGDINLATSTPGIYTVTYSFTGGACSNTATTSINIITAPQVTITNPPAACTPSTVDLTAASVTTGSTPGLTYTYFKDAAATITLTSPNAVALGGTYYIKGSAGSGCSDIQPVVVTINTKPTVVISDPPAVCSPGTVDLTAAAVTSGSPAGLTYTYFTDAGATITLAAPNAVAIGGTYYIKGTNVSGCSDVQPVIVTINALPTATIAYSANPYCATGTATVTQTGQAGGTYTAPAGVSITAATGAIDLGASTPGTYTITYSFTNGTCSNSTTTSITINALPTAAISYAGSPYCATGTATVTQTGQAGGTYTAPAALVINAVTGAIDLATSTPGAYTITYSFTSGGCSNSTTASITINPLPTGIISYTGSPYCATGTATVTQTGTAGGTYTAPSGVSITAATGDIDLAASTPGTYTITYSFSNGTCNNTTTTSVTINALPTATISYAGSPYCATGTATVSQTGPTGGTYSAPAGVSITAATGAINLATTTPGTYTVTYSYSNGTCSNTTAASITINALPTAAITYAASPYCATGTATVTQTGQPGGTYTAPGGIVINASTGDIDLTTSTAGTYTVTYSFSNGTCSNTTTTSITINALPTATIAYTGSPYCATGTATATQTGQAGGTYTAPAAVVINAATGDVNLTTSTPGTYTITYTFSNGTCSNTTSASITITALPTAAINYAGSPYCATGTATVTQTGTSGGTYTAPAGVVINSSTGVINLATSTPGTYTISYAFTSGACSNSTTTNITINSLPTATIAYPGSPYCATGTATVTQTGQVGGTYSAPAGVVIDASTGDINLATSTAGAYTITYSFTNGTCSNLTTTSITINSLPVATITYAGTPYCATGTASVTQTGQTGGTYTAPAGVVINASTGAINLATSTAGTYTVTYNFSNGTCSNSTTASITINALPTATIAYTGSPYCATGTGTATQTGTTGGTYSTPAGVVIDATTGDINLATSTPGTYTVTYSFTNGTCNNTTTTSITINALPTASISYAGSPYCATGSATVTQTGQAGGTYSAPAGVVIDATTGAIDLATSTAGTYTVTYNFSNGTCSNTTTASITINALPNATIAYTASPYCATGTATVTQSGQAGGTYTAPSGVVIDATTGAIDLATSTAGTYTITYSFGNGTCNNTTTTSIIINALPVATISYTGSPYCATGTASVTQTGQAGGSYAAPAGVVINASTGDIDLTASIPGTYSVTYSFSNGTCNNTTTTSITISALPTATIAYAGSPYCATGTATITQTGTTGGTYSAPAAVVINASTGAINLATSIPGTYTVTYSFSVGVCSNTTTTSITINPLPTAAISYAASPYCATGTATVTQTGQAGGTYTAPAGVVINASTGDIDLTTSTTGTYTVTYSFSNGTCSNTTTTSVTINALPVATIAYTGSPYCATGTATATQTGTAGGTYSAPAAVVIDASTGAINLGTSTPGTYTIVYAFSNGTCSNTTTASVTINALPTATINYAGSPYCATGIATVTQAGQAGGTYSSTAGLVITAATGDVDLVASTPGTYTVTYSFGNGTCTNTTTTTITINALPTATISYPASPYCATGTAAVTQTGTAGGTYTAPGGIVINASTGDIDLVTSTAGTYTITYTFSNGTCSNTTTTSVTINALPTATIVYAASPYCATGTATVTQAGQTGGTYSAPAAVVINASTGDINLATSMPGTYTVTYSFANGTCNNTTTTSITINALPIATILYPSSPYCATGTAAATQTGQAGGTYSAPAAVTIDATTGDINLGTSTAGTYTITYTFSDGTCSNTTTTSVTINALPTATINYVASPYCATGIATVTQTGQTGGTYSAPAGVVINATTGDINLSTSTSGTYVVTYTFTNGTCSNSTTTNITINALPTAAIVYTGSPYCATGTATVGRSGQPGGTYSSTAGLVIDATTGDIDLATSSVGTYTVTYAFGNGTCSNTTTTTITINALPTATIAYTGSPYCATGIATVTQTGQSGGTFTAPAGVVINAATGDIDLATSSAGTFTITYTFSNGTCSNTTTASVTINALPTATITYTGSPYCATGTATVTQAGQTGGAYSSTAGLIIDAATGSIDLVSSATGTYTVTYAFGNGTCTNTTTTTITINALPTATIAYPGSPYCATGVASVTQTGQAGGSYTAPAGVVINSSTGDIDLVASTAGTYTITYNFTNGTCNNSTTTSVTITSLPIITVTNPGAVCSPSTVDITAPAVTAGSDAGLIYSYYQDAAGTTTLANANAISANGTYYIKGTSATGCSDIKAVVVTINPKPTVVTTNPTPVCPPSTIDLTDPAVTTGSTGGLTYTYYTDAAGTTVLANANAVAVGGTYYIQGTTAAGCSDIQPVVVTFNALPVASIAYNGTPYCATGIAVVTLTGQPGGFFTGSAGTVIDGTTGDIDLAASTGGVHTITYTFSNGICSTTTTAPITINALPTASIFYAGSPYCATGSATVTQNGQTGGTYSSTTGLVIDANSGNIDLIGSTAGTYTVTYSFGNGTCSNTTTTNVTITALPTATIAYTGTPYCQNGTAIVSLTGAPGGVFSSTTGLVIAAASGDINLLASTEGTYTVTYSMISGSCSNSTTTTVTIKNPPLVITNPTGVCSPATIDLTNPAVTAGSQSGLTYAYYQDNTGTVPLLNPATVGTGGNYFIRGTDLVSGCSSNLQSVVVTIFTKPTISSSSSTNDICKGVNVTLTALSPGNSIEWLGQGPGNPILVSPLDSTLYQAVATTTNGCMDTTSIMINVNAFKLSLSANPDPVLAGTNTTLTTSGNFSYNVLSWSPDIFFADQTATTQNIVVKDTSKSFTVIAQSVDGCLDTATLFVTVDPNMKDFFIPNSFSPNGDGTNDIFKVYGSSVRDVTLRVFNQWGELIFETQNAGTGWDGTWKGRPQMVGVYVYQAKVTFYNNVTVTRKGTISLIR